MKIDNPKTAIPNSIGAHKKKADEELAKIGSGTKVKATDAAMMQIAQALMSDATVMAQGIQNANENIAMLQIADGVLRGVSATTIHLQELEVRANNATLNAEQKQMVEAEYNAQVKAMGDAVSQASYNGMPLFGRNFTSSLGDREISVTLPDLKSDTLALGKNEALQAFRESVDNALSEIGSGMNAYVSSVTSLLSARTNTLAAYSQMADTDMAKSVSSFKNENLLTQSALFMQSHAQELDRERIRTLLA